MFCSENGANVLRILYNIFKYDAYCHVKVETVVREHYVE